MELDMNREPENGLLEGTNLWEVRSCKADRSQKGDAMLLLKLKCGEHELTDRIMLVGGGWGIGKAKLVALGVAPTFSGDFDPLQLVGRKAWIATVKGSFDGIDKKTGAKKTFTKMEVDIAQLRHAGYQSAADVPAGVSAPVATAGNGPEDDTPF